MLTVPVQDLKFIRWDLGLCNVLNSIVDLVLSHFCGINKKNIYIFWFTSDFTVLDFKKFMK